MKLTNDQQAAVNEINRLINSGKKRITLTGSAGTGKTTLLRHLPVDVVCAPTNKAVKVLREKGFPDAKTIHKLFGLYLEWVYGEQVLQDNENEIDFYGMVVVVDEASMMNEELMNLVDTMGGTFIFVGDPYQLPPVNEEISVALNFNGYHLTDIIRQVADSPIIRLCQQIRQQQDKGKFDPDVLSEFGCITNRKEFELMYLDALNDESRDVRCVKYTNRSVDMFNDMVRKHLHGDDTPDYLQGETIVLQSPYSKGERVVLANGSEVEIDHVSRTQLTVDVPDYRPVPCHRIDSGSESMLVPEKGAFDATVNLLRESKEWDEIKRIHARTVRVKHKYAMTSHKSQGSTFDHCFVDARNIAQCRDEMTLLICLYVACSRPSDELTILWR